MEKRVSELINALNSDKIGEMLYSYYWDNEGMLKPLWRCPKKFTKYLKAYYLKLYLTSEKEKQDTIYNEIIDGNINVAVNYKFMNQIVASQANTTENIDFVSPKELTFLEDYEDDPLFDELSDDDDNIRNYVLKSEKIIQFDDLLTGEYIPIDDYVISKEELATIEKIKDFPELSDIAHEVSGELVDERVIINHPNKKNPQYGILFEDGTIVIYYNGDIRVLKMKLDEIIRYVKLQFIDYYYNAEDDGIFQTMVENYENFDFEDAKQPLVDMNNYTYDVMLAISSEFVISTIMSLHQTFSTKMIKEGKEFVESLGEHILHYHI